MLAALAALSQGQLAAAAVASTKDDFAKYDALVQLVPKVADASVDECRAVVLATVALPIETAPGPAKRDSLLSLVLLMNAAVQHRYAALLNVPEGRMNVYVPGVPVSGMAASAVKDPVVREAYEKALAENSRRLDAANQRRDMIDFDSRLADHARRLVELYYTSVDRAHVAEILNRSTLRPETKAHVLGGLPPDVPAAPKS